MSENYVRDMIFHFGVVSADLRHPVNLEQMVGALNIGNPGANFIFVCEGDSFIEWGEKVSLDGNDFLHVTFLHPFIIPIELKNRGTEISQLTAGIRLLLASFLPEGTRLADYTVLTDAEDWSTDVWVIAPGLGFIDANPKTDKEAGA